MKQFPAWALTLFCIAAILGVIGIAGRFSEKSPIFAAGTISITPELEAQAAELRNLFIVVYDLDNPGVMPYGALRVGLDRAPQGTFHHFILTKENLSVMAGKQAPDLSRLRIKARLSSSGFVGQDAQGDLSGEASEIPLGKETVQILIAGAEKPAP